MAFLRNLTHEIKVAQFSGSVSEKACYHHGEASLNGAIVGLAQNFGAVRSLVTTGIQKGHMKMHLLNIINQLGGTAEERKVIKDHFADKVVSHKAVVDYFCALRGITQEELQNQNK